MNLSEGGKANTSNYSYLSKGKKMRVNVKKPYKGGAMMDDLVSGNSMTLIIGIVIIAVIGFLVYEFVIKKNMFSNGLSSLGSGGTSTGIPQTPLHEPVINDSVSVNIGHGIGYGHIEYDIHKSANIENQKDKISVWEQEDIDINRKTQALQIPLLPPVHPWGNNDMLKKNYVGDFEKKIGIPVNPGHESNVTPAVEKEITGGPEYGSQKSHLSNGYIWGKIAKGNPTKHVVNGRVNNAVERIKTEIKDDKKKSADDVIQIALKQ